MQTDTIAAIATPQGRGGVAIVRLSGGDPLSVARAMFKPARKQCKFEPYRMEPGHIDAGSLNDFGLMVYFRAPHSFTGEDVVEFHCHGGVGIVRGVLRRALSLGCRLAERGEFTKRAFINGKLSLASAEGLVDMINGESEAEVRAGSLLYAEQLSAEVRAMQASLTELLAGIDADIDFPEEDIERTDLAQIGEGIGAIERRARKLAGGYGRGKKIKEGVRVVLAGKPNTGKSSLLNALLGSDRAIVSDIPGTTRDVVEGSLEIEGVHFDLYDTAGIRDGGDAIESQGIDRARRLIESADAVLFILDRSAPMTAEDREIYASVERKRRLVVGNKSDLVAADGSIHADICVSAKTGENIDALRQKLFEVCMDGYRADAEFVIEERHYAALSRAVEELELARTLAGTVPPDLLGVHLRAAWEALGEITGETANERIIDEIFAKFCVGK